MIQPLALLFDNLRLKIEKKGLLHFFNRGVEPEGRPEQVIRGGFKFGAFENRNGDAGDVPYAGFQFCYFQYAYGEYAFFPENRNPRFEGFIETLFLGMQFLNPQFGKPYLTLQLLLLEHQRGKVPLEHFEGIFLLF